MGQRKYICVSMCVCACALGSRKYAQLALATADSLSGCIRLTCGVDFPSLNLLPHVCLPNHRLIDMAFRLLLR